jgi:hypothetical protein
MFKKEDKTTKQDILRKIEVMLKENIDLDAKLVFARIEEFLEPKDKVESFTAGDIGYVHIDEKRQAEYLEWEKNIKQEWLVTIESIRESIKKTK